MIQSDEALDRAFARMKKNFDSDGSVFKGTTSWSQFLKQGEIDVVGVDLDGSVHAMDVAYHEAGLNYKGGVANRVLKELLRTMLILDAYHPENVEKHIYFVSPKLHPAAQQPLEEVFYKLQSEYQSVNWYLITNDDFTNKLLNPTLEKSENVSDTSELFIRSAKLLKLSGLTETERTDPPQDQIPEGQMASSLSNNSTAGNPGQIQPLVRSLMRTLLAPSLLTQRDLRRLMDSECCKNKLGLKLGNHALLRRQQDGRMISGHGRYWKDVYGGQYYVCSQWGKRDHCHNANSLLRFIEALIVQQAGNPGVAALKKHRAAFQNYLRTSC